MKFVAKEQERMGAVRSFSSGYAYFIVWRGFLIREMLMNKWIALWQKKEKRKKKTVLLS